MDPEPFREFHYALARVLGGYPDCLDLADALLASDGPLHPILRALGCRLRIEAHHSHAPIGEGDLPLWEMCGAEVDAIDALTFEQRQACLDAVAVTDG